MKKIIAYVRVSDKSKEDDKNSIPKQIDQINAWLRYKGFECEVEFIEDRQVSGSKEGRKGFQELIAKLKTGEYSHLIVRDLSRLVRSVEIGSAFFNRIIFKHKIIFHSLDDNIDTSTAVGKFFLNIMLAKDQYYRDQISEKVNNAITKKRSKGLAIGGTIPYGFTKDDQGRLIEVENQQEIIKLITKLKTDGRSYNDIRQTLIQMRIESPDGKYWHTGTIRRLHLSYLKNNRLAS